MDPITLILTIIGIVIALVFGYLQVIVPFTKKEVKFARKFPFVVSMSEIVLTKIDTKTYAKLIEKKFPIPAERRPIAVMPFKNLTGDTSFDYLSEAIPNLLITNLEQSKYLSVMTWERMHDVLGVLGKEDVQLMDEKMGFEVCKLDGVDAMALGSFTKAGEMFVTDVKVMDVVTKKLIKTANSRGKGIDSILENQINEISEDISLGIGLSEHAVKEANLDITEVTTNSIEAYNYFLKGRVEYEMSFGSLSAEKYLKKALEIDPNFAMAYSYLARNCVGLTNLNQARDYHKKAKIYSDKATDKEKLYIEAHYAGWVEHDRDKMHIIFKKLTQRYPRDKRTHYSLGWFYFTRHMYEEAIREHSKAYTLDPNYGFALNALSINYALIGDFEKALEYVTEYASALPGEADPFDTKGFIYIQMGEIDQALKEYKKAIEIRPDFIFSHAGIAQCHALKEDYNEAIKWIESFIESASSPGRKAVGRWWFGFYSYWLGQFSEALTQLQQAADIMNQEGCHHHEARIYKIMGWIYYEESDYPSSHKYYRKLSNSFEKHNPKHKSFYKAVYNFHTGLIDLKQAELDKAEEKANILEAALDDIKRPLHRERTLCYRGLLSGEIALARNSAEMAIAKYKAGIQHFKVGFSGLIEEAMDYYLQPCRDLLARAYHEKGDINKTITEYERLTTFDPKSKDRHLVYPKHRYELAKLYEEKGNKMKAVKEYEKFLDIWKNADADRPELIDAKKRLTNLKTRS
jgi:tetratricopeptide (TPR) repeat protein/TolB-like protein